MTAAMVRQRAVAAPMRQPLPGSILDCATVIEVDNLFNNYADGAWVSVACGPDRIIAAPLCSDAGGGLHPSKTFDAPTWAKSHNFALYRGVACSAVGFESTLSDLEAAFDLAEGLAVAKAISDIYQPTAADATAGYSPGTLSGSGVCAFAALAGHAVTNYGAQPTYLLPVASAVALTASQVLRALPNAQLAHAAGGCVALTPSLPSMLALGSVVIWRTPRVTQEVINPTTNQLSLLTERTYQVAVDCDYASKAPTTIDCAVLP